MTKKRKAKEKLTLSVDKEVIQKAKRLGINISEITERILRGYTSAEKPNGSLYDGYQQLFDSIAPLLREFGVNTKVGLRIENLKDSKGAVWDQPNDIFLESDGSLYSDLFEHTFQDIKEVGLQSFLSPGEVLSNLVDALVKSEEAREEKLREILMARGIINAMTKTLVQKNLARSRVKPKKTE